MINVRKIGIGVLIFITLVISIIAIMTVQKIHHRENVFEPKNPRNVKRDHEAIKSMANRTPVLNEHGFWEVDFDNGYVFVYVPEGEFIMGSKFGRIMERPQRNIT